MNLVQQPYVQPSGVEVEAKLADPERFARIVNQVIAAKFPQGRLPAGTIFVELMFYVPAQTVFVPARAVKFIAHARTTPDSERGPCPVPDAERQAAEAVKALRSIRLAAYN